MFWSYFREIQANVKSHVGTLKWHNEGQVQQQICISLVMYFFIIYYKTVIQKHLNQHVRQDFWERGHNKQHGINIRPSTLQYQDTSIAERTDVVYTGICIAHETRWGNHIAKGLLINYTSHFGVGLDQTPPMTPMTFLANSPPLYIYIYIFVSYLTPKRKLRKYTFTI